MLKYLGLGAAALVVAIIINNPEGSAAVVNKADPLVLTVLGVLATAGYVLLKTAVSVKLVGSVLYALLIIFVAYGAYSWLDSLWGFPTLLAQGTGIIILVAAALAFNPWSKSRR